MKYDNFDNIEASRIYVCRPNHQILFQLNGIDEDTCSLSQQFNNLSTISFTVNKYIDIDGEKVKSSGYDYLQPFMELFVENVGYFIMDYPQISNDNDIETKSIEATSEEVLLQKKDLVGFVVNSGTDSSLENLVTDDDGNKINIDEVTGLPYEYIKIYQDTSCFNQIIDMLNDDDCDTDELDSIIKSTFYKYPKMFEYEQNSLYEVHKTLKITSHDYSYDKDTKYLKATVDKDIKSFTFIGSLGSKTYTINDKNIEYSVNSQNNKTYDVIFKIDYRDFDSLIDNVFINCCFSSCGLTFDKTTASNAISNAITYYQNLGQSVGELSSILDSVNDDFVTNYELVGIAKKYPYIISNENDAKLEYTINDYSIFPNACEELIKYYKQLSLLDLAIEKSKCLWNVGYVNEEIAQRKYNFDVNENIYSFLTQTLAKSANVLILFNTLNRTINLYSVDEYGLDTNLFIDKKNIENKVDISCNADNISTRFRVYGNDKLNLTYVNFGSEYIENLDYFITAKDKNGNSIYVTEELATKFKEWQNYKEKQRNTYISLIKNYNDYIDKLSDINYRVPNDYCSMDWTGYTTDVLSSLLTSYENSLATLVSAFKNDTGYTTTGNDTDAEAYIKTTYYWYDYYAYKYVIIPSINIELDYRENIENYEEHPDYISSYETEWELYGLIELKSKLADYENRVQVLIDGGYTSERSEKDVASLYGISQGDYNIFYNEYQSYASEENETCTYDNIYQQYVTEENYDEENKSSIWSCIPYPEIFFDKNYFGLVNQCKQAINKRSVQIYNLETEQTSRETQLENIKRNILIENFESENNDLISNKFTEDELKVVNSLYKDTEYSNDNILTTDLDDLVSTVSVQEELLKYGKEKLSEVSQPQMQFSAEVDNLFDINVFKPYHSNFKIGNFIRLAIEDNYYIKLRIIETQSNPMKKGSSLSVTFSNLTRSNVECNDFVSLLDNATGNVSNTSGSSGSSGSGSLSTDLDIELSNTLLSALLKKETFGTYINDVILDNLKANNGYFKLISAQYATFQGLSGGETIIDGSCLQTGIIKSNNYNGNYSDTNDGLDNTQGSILRLTDGKFNFGNKIKFDGDILKVDGEIDGKCIKTGSITSYNYNGSKQTITADNGVVTKVSLRKDSTGTTTITETITHSISSTIETIDNIETIIETYITNVVVEESFVKAAKKFSTSFAINLVPSKVITTSTEYKTIKTIKNSIEERIVAEETQNWNKKEVDSVTTITQNIKNQKRVYDSSSLAYTWITTESNPTQNYVTEKYQILSLPIDSIWEKVEIYSINLYDIYLSLKDTDIFKYHNYNYDVFNDYNFAFSNFKDLSYNQVDNKLYLYKGIKCIDEISACAKNISKTGIYYIYDLTSDLTAMSSAIQGDINVQYEINIFNSRFLYNDEYTCERTDKYVFEQATNITENSRYYINSKTKNIKYNLSTNLYEDNLNETTSWNGFDYDSWSGYFSALEQFDNYTKMSCYQNGFELYRYFYIDKSILDTTFPDNPNYYDVNVLNGNICVAVLKKEYEWKKYYIVNNDYDETDTESVKEIVCQEVNNFKDSKEYGYLSRISNIDKTNCSTVEGVTSAGSLITYNREIFLDFNGDNYEDLYYVAQTGIYNDNIVEKTSYLFYSILLNSDNQWVVSYNECVVDASGNKIGSGINYDNLTDNNKGTLINITKGIFSFAGGKFKYDGSEMYLNGTIEADTGHIGGMKISKENGMYDEDSWDVFNSSIGCDDETGGRIYREVICRDSDLKIARYSSNILQMDKDINDSIYIWNNRDSQHYSVGYYGALRNPDYSDTPDDNYLLTSPDEKIFFSNAKIYWDLGVDNDEPSYSYLIERAYIKKNGNAFFSQLKTAHEGIVIQKHPKYLLPDKNNSSLYNPFLSMMENNPTSQIKIDTIDYTNKNGISYGSGTLTDTMILNSDNDITLKSGNGYNIRILSKMVFHDDLSVYGGNINLRNGEDTALKANEYNYQSSNYSGSSRSIAKMTHNDSNSWIAIGDNSVDIKLYGSAIASSKEISVSSDLTVKKDYSALEEKYENLFMNLKPIKFKYIDEDTDAFHIGFGVQHIEQALKDNNMTTKDFDVIYNGEIKGLKYTEFIALNTHMIQKLLTEVNDLKAQIKELKGEKEN